MLAPNIGDLEVARGAEVRAEPKVSVVIPAYRGKPEQPDWIDETLDSIRAQTFGDHEIVVVDDGSPVRIAPARQADLVMVRQPSTVLIRSASPASPPLGTRRAVPRPSSVTVSATRSPRLVTVMVAWLARLCLATLASSSAVQK